jgi:hypothetical protein
MLMTFHFHNHLKTFSNVSHDIEQGPNFKVHEMVPPIDFFFFHRDHSFLIVESKAFDRVVVIASILFSS